MSAGVRRAALVDDFAEHQHFAGAEDIGRRPVKCRPVDAQPQIALALRREAANRGAVKGEVVPALDQELLVVVEHVQPAFEVAEEHGHGLDALFVGQILQPLFLDLVDGRRGSCAAPSPSDSVLPVRRRRVPGNCAVRWTWISFSLHSCSARMMSASNRNGYRAVEMAGFNARTRRIARLRSDPPIEKADAQA